MGAKPGPFISIYVIELYIIFLEAFAVLVFGAALGAAFLAVPQAARAAVSLSPKPPVHFSD
jgi:hypothetical protein